MSDYETVAVTREGAIAQIAFDRPEAHNSLNERMASELASVANEVISDDDVRCITLTGNGPVFNTGADLTMLSGDSSDERRLRRLASGLHEFISQLIRAPKPVVTGVNGVAAGGGLGPAICGDIVLVGESARLEFAYPRIGLSADGGSTFLLPRLVGLRKAQQIVFRDDPIPAEEAVDLGLATEMVPDDDLKARVAEEADRLASGPTQAYAATKELLASSFGTSLEEQLAEEANGIAGLTSTEDFSRGHAAFDGDDDPDFVGR